MTGNTVTTYEVEFGLNLISEVPGTSNHAGLAVDASSLDLLDGRLGILGNSGDGNDASFNLVGAAASWKYLDDGSNQGTAWRESLFDDSNWASGTGRFGYGDGGEDTELHEFDDAGQRIRTVYFRHAFELSQLDKDRIDELVLDLLRDDGAAVYLNGIEIRRDNLDDDADFDKFADDSVSGDDEGKFVSSGVVPNLLVTGTNVLAVELHQYSDASSDLAFQLRLASVRTVPLVTLVPTNDPWGNMWSYLDDGSDQNTAWRDRNFNDSSWPRGSAELGYGDGDEQTTLDEFDADSTRIRTFYFRRPFVVADPSAYEELLVRLKYDDGAAVYLNGVEVIRENLDDNAAFDDLATDGADDEDEFFEFSVDVGLLRVGKNVLAVEVHQETDTSSDVSFDLQLQAVARATEVDRYTMDLTGLSGATIDIVLAGQDADFSGEWLELLDTDGYTVLALAKARPTKAAILRSPPTRPTAKSKSSSRHSTKTMSF